MSTIFTLGETYGGHRRDVLPPPGTIDYYVLPLVGVMFGHSTPPHQEKQELIDLWVYIDLVPVDIITGRNYYRLFTCSHLRQPFCSV